ncbi:MAG: hypothetical protein R2720_04410 [Candidatus Nanopelagicales bacterium]
MPKKVKRGKTVRLPRSTVQGSPLAWATTSKKVCTVMRAKGRKRAKVEGKKRGRCALAASAPALDGYTSYSKRFKVRVR